MVHGTPSLLWQDIFIEFYLLYVKINYMQTMIEIIKILRSVGLAAKFMRTASYDRENEFLY